MKKELKNLLDKIDKEQTKISYYGEYKISDEINKLFTKNEKNLDDDIAERIAFDFVPDYQSESDWGTYYGPKFILPLQNDNTKVNIYPHISQINENIIIHWEKRAKETQNLILKSRYADLVVDFKQKVLNKRARQEFYDIVINTNINICKQELVDCLSCKTKLKRALKLSLETKKEVPNYLVNSIIELDRKGEFGKPGTWGFAFRWLILEKNKKIKLDPKLANSLLNEILSKFKKTENNPYILEYITSLLTEYYSKNNDEESLLKILLEFEKKYRKFFDKQDSLSKSHAYNKILEIFSMYLNFPTVRKEKERLLHEIGKLELDWKKDLKQIPTKVEIPKEKIDKHLDFVFGEKRDESIEKVIERIIYLNIPKKEELEKQYIDLSSKYIFQHLATQQIIDHDGLVKAQFSSDIGSISSLKNPKFISEAGNYIQYGLFALSIDLEEFKKNFNEKELFDYLIEKPLFKDTDKNILEKILNSYYEKDFLVFTHLVMPFIEKVIRDFIKITGGNWITTNKYNGFTSLTLNEVLRDNYNQEAFRQVFGNKIGENILFYLKISLVEKLGLEIRTDIAHGKNMKIFFNFQISDLLFHILLIFSLIIKKD